MAKRGSEVAEKWRNGVEVTLWEDLGSWEWYNSHDPEDYYTGIFICEDGTKDVIDYDGVFELPAEVVMALELNGYNLDKLG